MVPPFIYFDVGGVIQRFFTIEFQTLYVKYLTSPPPHYHLLKVLSKTSLLTISTARGSS